MSQNLTDSLVFPLLNNIQYLLVFIFFHQHFLILTLSVKLILFSLLHIHISIAYHLCLTPKSMSLSPLHTELFQMKPFIILTFIPDSFYQWISFIIIIL